MDKKIVPGSIVIYQRKFWEVMSVGSSRVCLCSPWVVGTKNIPGESLNYSLPIKEVYLVTEHNRLVKALYEKTYIASSRFDKNVSFIWQREYLTGWTK